MTGLLYAYERAEKSQALAISHVLFQRGVKNDQISRITYFIDIRAV